MANEYTESLDTILQDTVPELPGVVRAVAERELRLTFREFFERTYAWRVVLEGLNAPAGNTAILLDDSNDLDANSDVIGIFDVVYNGNVLRKLPRKPNRVNTTTDLPTHFWATSNPDEFKLYPPLENASTGLMDVHVALTPKFNATTFPRQITSKYYDALREGFLARMYGQPAKPYSAPVVAQQKRHNFKRMMGYYMAQAKGGYIDAQSWSFPGGWNPRNYNQGV